MPNSSSVSNIFIQRESYVFRKSRRVNSMGGRVKWHKKRRRCRSCTLISTRLTVASRFEITSQMSFFNKAVSLSPSRFKERFRRSSSTPKSRGRNRSKSEDIRAIVREENDENHHPVRASELCSRLGEEECPRSSLDLDNSDEIFKSSPKPRHCYTRSLSRSRRNVATRPLHGWNKSTGAGLVKTGENGATIPIPSTRMAVKQQARTRNWFQQCKKMTYLTLDDLPLEDKPRMTRNNAVTPFSLELERVEGWKIPSSLVSKVSQSGTSLSFTLSVSFFHAGSKRFYGNTYMGSTPVKEDDDNDGYRYVIYNDEEQGVARGQSKKRQHSRKQSRTVRNSRNNSSPGRRVYQSDNHTMRSRHNSPHNGRKKKWESANSRGVTTDNVEDMDITVIHNDIAYFYSRYEDPNCLLVIELVANEVDKHKDITLGSYGCGWTFIQMFGPLDPEAQTQRDVYLGSPRTLLFFDAEDFQHISDMAIPGCTLSFRLSIFPKLLTAQHLLRENEIVGALETIAGLEVQESVLSGVISMTACIGYKVEAQRGHEGVSLHPLRPKLAPVYELRIQKLRIIVPNRMNYERALQQSFCNELPEVEIIKSSKIRGVAGFSTSSKKVVGQGGRADDIKARIVGRRVKVGLHNGHSLVLPQGWVESNLLESENVDDALVLPDEVRSLDIEGYAKDSLMALVVVLEYIIRTKSKEASKAAHSGGARRGIHQQDAVSAAQSELQSRALPIIAGMAVFIIYDGKRMRLRNTPFPEHSSEEGGGNKMDIELPLFSDHRIRNVSPGSAFYGGGTNGYIANVTTCDNQQESRETGEKSVMFNLRCSDPNGRSIKDETPIKDEDESDFESKLELVADNNTSKLGDVTMDNGSDESEKETVVSTNSSYSTSTRSTVTVEEEEQQTVEEAVPLNLDKATNSTRHSSLSSSPNSISSQSQREHKTKHHQPIITSKPDPVEELDSSESNSSPRTDWSSSSDSEAPSHISSHNSSKNQALKSNQAISQHHSSFDTSSRTLNQHAKIDNNSVNAILDDPEPEPLKTVVQNAYTLTAAVVGGSGGGVYPFTGAKGLSRASKTRLARYGYMDVTVPQDNNIQMGSTLSPADLNIELPDSFSLNEITLQFAGFRAPRPGMPLPKSIYFSYQFYTIKPIETDRMFLRSGQVDNSPHVPEPSTDSLHVLVDNVEGPRGNRYDAPAPSIKHGFDLAAMQPFEAENFVEYMAQGNLYVDVWDGDAKILMGTFSLPLRPLLRQGKPVVKLSCELEVISPGGGGGDDSSVYGGIAIGHGRITRGPVCGMIQVLACNYGEVSHSTRPGAIVRRPTSSNDPSPEAIFNPGGNNFDDWRLNISRDRASNGVGLAHRPHHRVRARPLTASNPDLFQHLDALRISSSSSSSYAKSRWMSSTRGLTDRSSIGYDELLLLARRFRGPTRETVKYKGRMMGLLCVPPIEALEKKFANFLSHLGMGVLESAYRRFECNESRQLSIPRAETMLRAIGACDKGRLKHEQLLVLLRRIESRTEETGISLKQLLAWIHCQQSGSTDGHKINSQMESEARASIQWCLKQADALNIRFEKVFSALDLDNDGKLSLDEMYKCFYSIGLLRTVSWSMVEPVILKTATVKDINNNSLVSLSHFSTWARIDGGTTFTMNQDRTLMSLRHVILQAERVNGISVEKIFGALNMKNALTKSDIETGLTKIGVTKPDCISTEEFRMLVEQFSRTDPNTISQAKISLPNFMLFLGRNWEVSVDGPNGRLLKQFIHSKEKANGKDLLERALTAESNIRSRLGLIPLDAVIKWLKIPKDGSTRENIISRDSAQRVLTEFDDCGNGYLSFPKLMAWLERNPTPNSFAEAELKHALLQTDTCSIGLEDSLIAMDLEGTGRISTKKIEEHLQNSSFYSSTLSQALNALCKKMNGSEIDDSLSCSRFMNWLGRPYNPIATASMKLRCILVRAEQNGPCLGSTFRGYDITHTGRIEANELEEGIYSMRGLENIERAEVQYVIAQFKRNEDRKVSLPEFLSFVGCPYTVNDDPVETRLRTLVGTAKQLGSSPIDIFKHLDKDGSGVITKEELICGLQELGIFGELSKDEVESITKRFSLGDSPNQISIKYILNFLGTEYKTSLALVLQNICTHTEDMENPVRDFFTYFDVNGDGVISEDDLHTGLDQLGNFHHVSKGDVHDFVQMFSNLGNNLNPGITEEAFEDFFYCLLSKEDNRGPQEICRSTQNKPRLIPPLELPAAVSSNPEEHLLAKLVMKSSTAATIEHFRSFDANGTNSLDVQQFEWAIRSLGIGAEKLSRKEVNLAARQIGLDFSFSNMKRIILTLEEIAIWLAKNAPDIPVIKCEFSSSLQTKENNNECTAASEDDEALKELCSVICNQERQGKTLEKILGPLDSDGDGLVSMKDLIVGLEQMGALDSMSPDRIDTAIHAFLTLSWNSQPNNISVVSFMHCIRDYNAFQKNAAGGFHDDPLQVNDSKDNEYVFSTDPETREAEKKVRRIVAPQLRRGIDVEAIFQKIDSSGTGVILRSDFVQVLMEMGLTFIENTGCEKSSTSLPSSNESFVQMRQAAQVARAKGPEERRLMRMRVHGNKMDRGEIDNKRISLISREPPPPPWLNGSGDQFSYDMESLSLINWVREGKKKASIKAVNLFFSFGRTLYFEHPFRNPFGQEERFIIEIEDAELKVVTNAEEWTYLRRNVKPCVGEVTQENVESDFFDVDVKRGDVHITLMPYETVYVPFSMLSLSLDTAGIPSSSQEVPGSQNKEPGSYNTNHPLQAERSAQVSFTSASRGRAHPVHRIFRFYQAEGEIMKRSIHLLPTELPPLINGRSTCATPTNSMKYVHCVEPEQKHSGKVLVEWKTQALIPGHRNPVIHELFLKYRVGVFPSVGTFYILLYNDPYQGSLFEIWRVIVHARLRLHIQAVLGDTTPAELAVQGDRYPRTVECFSSSSPDCVTFKPAGRFQLTADAYNRFQLEYWPRVAGNSKLHVHMVDVNTKEMVGAWLATVTALPPVVTKTYDIDIPIGDDGANKRIAYTNTWGRGRVFRLRSSNPDVTEVKYENLNVPNGGTGFIRLWFKGGKAKGECSEVFIYVNDENGRNEECLLLRVKYT